MGGTNGNHQVLSQIAAYFMTSGLPVFMAFMLFSNFSMKSIDKRNSKSHETNHST